MDSWLVLRRFGRVRENAIRNYREFIASGVGMAEDDLIKVLRMSNAGKANMFDPGCWVIGDPEFVKSALATDKQNRIRLTRYSAEGVTLESVSTAFCKVAGITKERLLTHSRGTHFSALRHVFAHLCRNEYGFPVVEIGRFLGISTPTGTLNIAKGAVISKEKPYVNLIAKVRP